jgi:hypothetical protein
MPDMQLVSHNCGAQSTHITHKREDPMKLQFESYDDETVALIDPQHSLSLNMENEDLFIKDREPSFVNYETSFFVEESDSMLAEDVYSFAMI